MMAALVAAASCAKEPAQNWSGAMPVSIDPTITRATEVDFEENDAVGLTITTAEAAQVALNAEMRFNGETFVSADGLLWYEDLGLTSTLKAYYPYVEGEALPTEFSITADQTGEGFYASDLMMAQKEGVKPSVNAVDMTFYHQLTKIVINLENEYGLTVEGVTLHNVVPTATIDVEAQSVAVKEGVDPISVQALEVTADQKYAAIIVPQSVALKVDITVNNNGKSETHTQRLAEAQLQGGGQYSMDVTLLPSEVSVTLSGDIAGWEDLGSLTAGEVPFEEFDTYFVYDGQTYNFKTLADGNTWMTDNLRFVPDGKSVSSDPTEESGVWYPYTSDGTTQTPVTDAEGVAELGLLYNTATALGVKEITLENASTLEGVQGICPKGWHIPTLAEIQGLVGTVNGLTTNAEAAYYNTDYNGGMITEMNEAGFNFTYSGTRTTTGYQKGTSTAPTQPMTFIQGSTLYKTTTNTDGSFKSAQFYSLMSTANSDTYPNGRLNGSYQQHYFGVTVRCVRDTAK